MVTKSYDLDIIKKEIADFKIDSTDILIMTLCFDEVLSVSDLQRSLKIAYKNLLPHLKKLEKYEFIKIKDYGRGKPKEIMTNKGKDEVHAFLLLFDIPKILKKAEK